MTSLAPHIEAFLREHLVRHRGASQHTCDSYAYSFQSLFEFAAQKLKVAPSASMRRPADVNNNLWADQLAASPPTNGRRRGVRPCFPFPGKGFSSLSPNRPASIRTLCGAVCSGASWGSQSSTGADYL
jgi:hypothetical protein